MIHVHVEVVSPEIIYPPLPEFGLRELLAQEKDASGMYFSGHLLDGFSNALADPAIREIRALVETDDNGELLLADRAKVTVAGIVTSVTMKTTKKDDRMAFFTLEDRYGEIECLAFPKIYTQFAHILHTDAVLRIEGELSIREEEAPKVLVSRIAELPDNRTLTAPVERQAAKPAAKQAPVSISPANAKILYLRVPSLSDEKWRRACNILEIFEGELPVSVYDSSTKSYKRLEGGFDCTAFTVAELVEILGADNVVLK